MVFGLEAEGPVPPPLSVGDRTREGNVCDEYVLTSVGLMHMSTYMYMHACFMYIPEVLDSVASELWPGWEGCLLLWGTCINHLSVCLPACLSVYPFTCHLTAYLFT